MTTLAKILLLFLLIAVVAAALGMSPKPQAIEVGRASPRADTNTLSVGRASPRAASLTTNTLPLPFPDPATARAVAAPPTNRTLRIEFDPAPALFTNQITITTSTTAATNGFIWITNTTRTVTEIVRVAPATNYLITLTPGTNWYAAATNTAAPLRVITNASPALLIVPELPTNYIVSGWAYLRDGGLVPVGQWKFPSAPNNVIALRAWLVAKTNLAAPWSRELKLGEHAITNATGRQKFFASEIEEISTDYAPKFGRLTRNILTSP